MVHQDISSGEEGGASGGNDDETASPSSPEPNCDLTDNDETHQKTHGSQTHWTYMNKSLRRYITEALPRESNYRNILSIGQNNTDIRKFSRPTLEELHKPEEAGKLLAHNNSATVVTKVNHERSPYSEKD